MMTENEVYETIQELQSEVYRLKDQNLFLQKEVDELRAELSDIDQELDNIENRDYAQEWARGGINV